MTVELITGYSGAPHIDSSDVQHLIAGVVGPGSYVLQTQNKLSLTVNSANKVTLNTGDAVIAGGAHVRVSAAEALTVTSGTQGANRNDLVVLRYTKNSSNVESAAAVVIKGTATSGTASDPAYNTGSIIDGKTTVDMPLYRIPISGVNLGTPVKLFSEQPSMRALGDSLSKIVRTVYDNAGLEPIESSGAFDVATGKYSVGDFSGASFIIVMAGKTYDGDSSYGSVVLPVVDGYCGSVVVGYWMGDLEEAQIASMRVSVRGSDGLGLSFNQTFVHDIAGTFASLANGESETKRWVIRRVVGVWPR